MAQWLTNPTSTWLQFLEFKSHSVGEGFVAASRRDGLDPMLLWLWCRPAAAAPIQSLAWELPYAIGGGPKKDRNIKGGDTGLLT